MRRSTVRALALFVLVLLGAPVAIHVIMHDLHDHDSEHAGAFTYGESHTDHEHPIVSAPSHQLPGLSRAVTAVVAATLSDLQQRARIMKDLRNVIAHGALHSFDDSGGLQSLFSTYLI